MAHVFVLGGLPESLVNFRGTLLKAMVSRGHRISCGAAGTAPSVMDELEDLGIVYYPLPLARAGINPFADLRFARALRAELGNLKPSHFLAYTIKPVVYGCPAACTAGIENIWGLITGLGYAFIESSSWKQKCIGLVARCLYRRGLKYCRGVFFQNQDDQDEFVKLHLLGSTTPSYVVNGSGVDVAYFAHTPGDSQKKTFLLIARLLRDKGIYEYVEAARLLKARHPEARCLLAGPTDPNPAAIRIEEVEAWVREGCIEYLGVLDDVRPALKACGVYVLPSYREGMPRTVLEAMATGRPIITTDTPGCRETVVEGENGYLVPVRDAVSLFKAMERCITDGEQISHMGERSREIAVAKYDVLKVNEAMLKAMGLN